VSPLNFPAAQSLTNPARPGFFEGERTMNRPTVSRWRTSGRSKVLGRRYAAGDKMGAIIAELRGMPGPELPGATHAQTSHHVSVWAAQLGFRRPKKGDVA
jgi:hypothetical protein